MSIIKVDSLCKHYKVLNRQEGLLGAIKDLVSKDYKTVKAVNEISMEIQEGQLVGFIGPNGAGKSTTIKMLTGVLKPTLGSIEINGFIPYKQRRKYTKTIGVVLGQRSQLWWDLPVIESFKLLKEVYQIDKKTYDENLGLFGDMADIKKLYSIPTRNLSLGQRMLCDIAASFLHDPKLVFLDEPTIGLDIGIKKTITDIIKNFNEMKKTTILLTSHDISNIEQLCERIILIDSGNLVYDGQIGKFISMFGTYRTLELEVGDTGSIDLDGINTQLSRQFKQTAEVKDCLVVRKKQEPGWLTLNIDQNDVKLFDVLNYISQHISINDVKIKEILLEHAIQRIYENKKI